jgi:hypothetical protein
MMRSHLAEKRGAERPKGPLEGVIAMSKVRPGDLLTLDESLPVGRGSILAGSRRRGKSFCRLEHRGQFGITGNFRAATVKHDWRVARAFLVLEIAKN